MLFPMFDRVRRDDAEEAWVVVGTPSNCIIAKTGEKAYALRSDAGAMTIVTQPDMEDGSVHSII